MITPGQPSCNPRIVKVADALSAAGHEVEMLYNYFVDWADSADKKLLPQVSWKARLIGGSPVIHTLLFKVSKIKYKIYRSLYRIFGNRFQLAERSKSRCFDGLLQKAKSIKADWYIAHNLGALPVAVLAAKYHQAKCAFDFEDYHRGENTDPEFLKRVTYLEEKYVPQLDQITAASPLISSQVKTHFPEFEVTTILNCFSIKHLQFPQQKNVDGPIRLGWFSQTIGAGRGLEALLGALREMPNGHFELHLLGNYTDTIRQQFDSMMGANAKALHWYKPVASDEIFDWASKMDVGLALEIPNTINHDICLSNKIFTYLLAGNALLFSNTKGQQQFYEENPGIGLLVRNGRTDDLKDALMHVYNDREALHAMKLNAYECAKIRYHWELEGQKLLEVFG